MNLDQNEENLPNVDNFSQTPENQFSSNAYNNEITQVKPENNLVLAIVGTIIGFYSPFCCIGVIPGIIAIVMSTQVDSKYAAGDFAGAESAAKNAKTLAYIALALGIIGLIIKIIQIVFFGGMAAIESYQDIINQSLNR